MTNPIDKPDFNPSAYREPNPATIATIKELADKYHAASAQAREARWALDAAIREAKATGHSFPQLRDASGISIATIQSILEKGE